MSKLLLCLVWMGAFASLHAIDTIKVVSSIDEDLATENAPLKGTVIVTHNQSDKIDEKSFLIGNDHLDVTYIDEKKVASPNPLVLSIYAFQIPGKPKGLYVLPAVDVTIAGKHYQSAMSTYEVIGNPDSPPSHSAPSNQHQNSAPPASQPANTPSTSAPKGAPHSNAILKLEAFVQGKMPLYPGQRAKLTYKYYFNDDIELTSEHIPLLDADGLIKIGEKEIVDSTKDGFNIREISQEVEADKPGTFSFGPSVIEGYAYATVGGQRHYTSDKLHYEVPPVVVTVIPFPAEGKPASFNGAVGTDFQFKVSLLTDPEVSEGEEIALSVDISGSDNIKNVSLPEICCQPGFSGFFRMNDLPPVGEMHGEAKNFVVKMRPLSESIRAIPSVEFSYFNPVEAKYVIVRSPPIPITVKSVAKPATTTSAPEPAAEQQPSTPAPQKAPQPTGLDPIEIQGIFPLVPADLHNRPFGNWWVFGLIPFGIALLIYQTQVREFLKRHRTLIKPKTSQELLQEAKQFPVGSQAYFSAINHALMVALVEAHLISSADISPEDLADAGLAGEVHQFIAAIEETRFAGHNETKDDLWLPKAQELRQKIQQANVKEEASHES